MDQQNIVEKLFAAALRHHQASHLVEAEGLYRQILVQHPNHDESLHLLGLVALQRGHHDAAEALIAKAITVNGVNPAFHMNLGLALRKRGAVEDALAAYKRALSLKPDFEGAHNNLGNFFNERLRLKEAETSYKAALALKPDYAEAHNNLGNIFKDKDRLDWAAQSYRHALAINANSAEGHKNLGGVLKDQGRLGEAVESYRRALELNPDYAEVSSNLLFCHAHQEGITATELYAEHCRFADRFETKLRTDWRQHRNSRERERYLAVGFVSGDLRSHAVANFIEPVVALLAKNEQLSLHAYYDHPSEDQVTQRLRNQFARWNAVAGLSDQILADKIAADGIDILIDLSGHTSHHRLLTFARKPAPIQASWIGYPGTTGLQAMDYYLTDRFFLPPGQFDDQFTEKLVHLPASAPFLPAAEAPAVNDLPALTNGFITFGSFNRLSKLNPSVIALWSRLLRAFPAAKILLGGLPHDDSHERLVEWFEQEGVGRERLRFARRSSMASYLAQYHGVDFCLDSFPYTGDTTTNHGLWMGVPTLTLAGLTPAGREGAAKLAHVGLADFIAQDKDDFVEKGLFWANNLSQLAELRAGLRERCATSPIRSPEIVADGLARALRLMWQRWCDGLPPRTFEVKSPSPHRLCRLEF